MSFRTKLLLGVFVLVSAFAAIAPAVVQAVVADQFRRATDDLFAQATALLRFVASERTSQVQFLLAPMAEDARVRAALYAHGGIADPEKLKGETDAETRKKANEYLASFIDEYGEYGGGKQSFLLLVGRDGTVVYGDAGEDDAGGRVELDDSILSERQLAHLLSEVLSRGGYANMLWSGPRLRSADERLRTMGRGLYLAGARLLKYASTGIGAPERVGVVVSAIHDFPLGELARHSAVEVVFIDREEPIASTLPMRALPEDAAKRRANSAAKWLAGRPADELRTVELDGVSHYARPLDFPNLVEGPVRAGLFLSREREQAAIASAKRALFVTSGVLLALGLLGAIFLSRGLSGPVRALAEASRAVAGGRLDTRVEIRSRDELGALAVEFNQMVQGLRERERAAAALGKYLSPEMAAELLARGDRLELHGEKRPLTILFSDIAGFTSLAERLEPERIVALLNRYFDRMVDILHAQSAYVDKFEGDAIMAFWGAPIPSENHAVKGCLAALKMREAADALAAEWRGQGLPELVVRYGLNTGPVVVGNLGSSRKVNYTAIGDDVNLASRLEGANKEYGTRILIGEATYAQAKDAIEVREIDLLRVKGKSEAVRVYEVLAEKGRLSPELAERCRRHAEALSLYRSKRFADALAIFDEWPDDGASRTFAQRCRSFLESPPPPDWDGTFDMKSK